MNPSINLKLPPEDSVDHDDEMIRGRGKLRGTPNITPAVNRFRTDSISFHPWITRALFLPIKASKEEENNNKKKRLKEKMVLIDVRKGKKTRDARRRWCRWKCDVRENGCSKRFKGRGKVGSFPFPMWDWDGGGFRIIN